MLHRPAPQYRYFEDEVKQAREISGEWSICLLHGMDYAGILAWRSDELHVDAADRGRLLELLSLVPDPRKRRGVRHSVAAILAIAAAAVLAPKRR